MPWSISTAGHGRPLSRQLRRFLSVVLLLSLASSAVRAQDRASDCDAELAALDRAFVAAMAKILAAGAGPLIEQCAALAGQMDLIARERALHVRCLPPGEQLNGVLAMLNSSAVDFRQAQVQLGCNTTASLAPADAAG